MHTICVDTVKQLETYYVFYNLSFYNRLFTIVATGETDPDFDHCAVCIESYKQNDVVRILPCKYVGFLCLK